MAVDYQEVNLQLDGTVIQLTYQPMLFQKLGGQKYFAKVDNLWGYHQLRLEQESSEVTATYHTMGCPSFPGLPIQNFDTTWRISSQNGSRNTSRLLSE